MLKGFIFSPSRAKILFIFVHGLSGSLLSRIELAFELAKSGAAVLTFNNRGYGIINHFNRINRQGRRAEIIGQAHEVFTDCVDDLEGAVRFGVKAGYKKIILVGHSTGCNKIAYYLAKKSPAVVKGAVFLGPMSDYASVHQIAPEVVCRRAVAHARRLVAVGRPHELLPASLWPDVIDAQRFLSLYIPESLEEIFSYAVVGKKPAILRQVRKPLLVILAENDEFRDRPTVEIVRWFKGASSGRLMSVKIIKNSLHHFQGFSRPVKKMILNWSDKINR
jgi:pimeloyl-ACP methyl ester carboxylesterase